MSNLEKSRVIKKNDKTNQTITRKIEVNEHNMNNIDEMLKDFKLNKPKVQSVNNSVKIDAPEIKKPVLPEIKKLVSPKVSSEMIQPIKNTYQMVIKPDYTTVEKPISTLKNILLVDRYVNNFDKWINSSNEQTLAISINPDTNRADLKAILKTYMVNIDRIAFVYDNISLGGRSFINFEKFFTDDDLTETDVNNVSDNFKFINELVTEFNIKNLDFLACKSLLNEQWKQYYNQLAKFNNGLVIGASNDDTGNYTSSGDWIMETTEQDIQNIYFNSSITTLVGVLDLLDRDYPTTYNIDPSTEITSDQLDQWHTGCGGNFNISLNTGGTYNINIPNYTINYAFKIIINYSSTTLAGNNSIIGFDNSNGAYNNYTGLIRIGNNNLSNIIIENININTGSGNIDNYSGWLLTNNHNNSHININSCNINSNNNYITNSKVYSGGFMGGSTSLCQINMVDCSIISICSTTDNIINQNGNFCGGFISAITGESTFTNCSLKIINENDNNVNLNNGGEVCGGFVGIAYYNTTFTNCSIESTSNYNGNFIINNNCIDNNGGFIGNSINTCTFTDCSIKIIYTGTGNVIINNNSNISNYYNGNGGFIGRGYINQTTNFINCSIEIKNTSDNNQVIINNSSTNSGGYIGYSEGTNNFTDCFIEITNTSNNNQVIINNSSTNSGGFMGYSNGNNTFTNSFIEIINNGNGNITINSGGINNGGILGTVNFITTNTFTNISIKITYTGNGNIIINSCGDNNDGNSNGGIVGTITNNTTNIFINCSIQITYTGSGSIAINSNVYNSGGLLGYYYIDNYNELLSNRFNNCSIQITYIDIGNGSITINDTTTYCGGIIGCINNVDNTLIDCSIQINYSFINDSNGAGNIYINNNGTDYNGGIVGYTYNNETNNLTNCSLQITYNGTGNIYINQNTGSLLNGGNGSILGYTNANNNIFTNCSIQIIYAGSGDITINKNSYNNGGIIGIIYGNNSSFTNCSIQITYTGSGNISINSNCYNCGGILGINGYSTASFTNCFIQITYTGSGYIVVNDNIDMDLLIIPYNGGILGVCEIGTINTFIDCSIEINYNFITDSGSIKINNNGYGFGGILGFSNETTLNTFNNCLIKIIYNGNNNIIINNNDNDSINSGLNGGILSSCGNDSTNNFTNCSLQIIYTGSGNTYINKSNNSSISDSGIISNSGGILGVSTISSICTFNNCSIQITYNGSGIALINSGAYLCGGIIGYGRAITILNCSIYINTNSKTYINNDSNNCSGVIGICKNTLVIENINMEINSSESDIILSYNSSNCAGLIGSLNLKGKSTSNIINIENSYVKLKAFGDISVSENDTTSATFNGGIMGGSNGSSSDTNITINNSYVEITSLAGDTYISKKCNGDGGIIGGNNSCNGTTKITVLECYLSMKSNNNYIAYYSNSIGGIMGGHNNYYDINNNNDINGNITINIINSYVALESINTSIDMPNGSYIASNYSTVSGGIIGGQNNYTTGQNINSIINIISSSFATIKGSNTYLLENAALSISGGIMGGYNNICNNILNNTINPINNCINIIGCEAILRVSLSKNSANTGGILGGLNNIIAVTSNPINFQLKNYINICNTSLKILNGNLSDNSNFVGGIMGGANSIMSTTGTGIIDNKINLYNNIVSIEGRKGKGLINFNGSTYTGGILGGLNGYNNNTNLKINIDNTILYCPNSTIDNFDENSGYLSGTNYVTDNSYYNYFTNNKFYLITGDDNVDYSNLFSFDKDSSNINYGDFTFSSMIIDPTVVDTALLYNLDSLYTNNIAPIPTSSDDLNLFDYISSGIITFAQASNNNVIWMDSIHNIRLAPAKIGFISPVSFILPDMIPQTSNLSNVIKEIVKNNEKYSYPARHVLENVNVSIPSIQVERPLYIDDRIIFNYTYDTNHLDTLNQVLNYYYNIILNNIPSGITPGLNKLIISNKLPSIVQKVISLINMH